MIKKFLMTLLTVSLLLINGTQNTSAKELDYGDYIQVINNETQEVIDIEVKEITTRTVPTESDSATYNLTNSYAEEVEIEFDIPELKDKMSRSSSDSSNNHGDFVAYLKINYQTSGTASLPTIKVTSVSGNWKCNATSYTARFENREVLVKQGNWLYDDTLVKYPTSNSFSYSTGWGYVDDLPKTDYSGVYAFSTAKAIINGMGGGYTLNVSITR